MTTMTEKDTQTGQSDHTENIIIEADQPEEQYWLSFRFLGSLLAIVLLGNSLFVGYSMPVNILTVINADIGPSPNIYLVTLVFTLVSGVLLLVFGRISDIIGRRYFIITAQLFAVVGSIICAKANSVNVVVAGTVLTGIAGGAQQLYPLLIQELVPNKYRIYGQAAITLGLSPTIGFGPAIARTLVERTALGWRWCYWLNVIVSGLSVVLFILCYFPPNFHMINKKMTKLQEMKQLDYVGLLLYCSGLILLLLGFTWAQGTYPWKSSHVIATIIVGAVVLIAFTLYGQYCITQNPHIAPNRYTEIYVPLAQPLMPMKLLKIRNFAAVVVVGCVGQMVFYALNTLWPPAISVFFTTDNIKIGLMSSTTGISLALGEVIVSPFFKLVGRPNWQLTIASATLALFAALMSLVDQHQQALGIALTVLAGVAVGWIEAVAIIIAGLVVDPNDIGAGQGFFASMRAVTGTIALSIYVAIYSDRLTAILPKDITSYTTAAGLPESSLPSLFNATAVGTPEALNSVPGMNGTILAALNEGTMAAYKSSFRVVYLASLAFGVVSIISALFVRDISEYLTNFVNKRIHEPQLRHRQEDSEAEMKGTSTESNEV